MDDNRFHRGFEIWDRGLSNRFFLTSFNCSFVLRVTRFLSYFITRRRYPGRVFFVGRHDTALGRISNGSQANCNRLSVKYFVL